MRAGYWVCNGLTAEREQGKKISRLTVSFEIFKKLKKKKTSLSGQFHPWNETENLRFQFYGTENRTGTSRNRSKSVGLVGSFCTPLV